MPKVGLGTWKMPSAEAGTLVYEAIKSGVRHIDCACDYGNEEIVGAGIKRAISEGIVERKDLWVTSKLWNTYHAKEHVELACRKSLADLGLDYVDLYLIHFPISQKFVPIETRYPPEWVHDPSGENPKIELAPVPLSETWGAMEELVQKGLTKHIGICNVMVFTLMDLLSYAKIPPAVLQVEVHPYLTQQALLDFCKASNIHVTAFSPLGSGSYIELGMDFGLGVGVLKEPSVLEIATAVGKTAAQVALRWGVQRGCSVIPKSSSIARIRENFDVLSFELSAEQMATIDSLNKNQRFNDPGKF
ncbi:unnamed protein product, partial [Ectocarpus fasciculatus]